MPSLPTSLIVVGLVVAWLVVLVPMVSRRREEVPQSAEDSPRIRILGRGARGSRRRAVLSRTAILHRTRPDMSAAESTGHHDDGTSNDSAGSAPAGDGESAETVGSTSYLGRDDAPAPVEPADGARGGSLAVDDDAAPGDADDNASMDAARAQGRAPTGSGFDDRTHGQGGTVSTPRRTRRDLPADSVLRGPMSDDYEGATYRRVPLRPGRGGYDPAAAQQASDYRFRQRRRVALVLAVIVTIGTAIGLLGAGYGYVAAVGGGALLMLYFAYLRRQVRIEDEIQQRRAARLERARQIRPGYRPSVAEQVYAHRTGEIPRPGVDDGYQVKSHARTATPASAYRYGEPVDFEDSDPAFDDLEYYRPAALRRRAG